MKNYWVTASDPFASWVADLSPLRGDPGALLAWIRSLLEAGEETAVCQVMCAPSAQYRYERHGAFADHLEHRFVESGAVDLGFFGDSAAIAVEGERLVVRALMSFVDEDGAVVGQPVEELDVVLRELRPEVDESAFGAWCPPVYLLGPLVGFRPDAPSRWISGPDTVRVRISLGSDIWFPWVYGWLEEDRRTDRLYDNRALSSFHTPRFNAFLDVVRRTTLDVGGRWEFDRDVGNLAAPGILSERGIELDSAELVREWINWPKPYVSEF